MGHVPLDVHLRLFSFGRGGQRHDPKSARAHSLSERLDDAALSSAVASFEDNANLLLLTTNPFLELHEFDVQSRQFFLVCFPFQLSGFEPGFRTRYGVRLGILVFLRLSHKSMTLNTRQARYRMQSLQRQSERTKEEVGR